jgi:alkanesulfonate monooxygenase SsuD/methylene tetrahydromethanopterin reductase-like flavin-dependent oxidoreductase (luciferase family)
LFRTPQLHLAVALESAGWHPAAWREPQARDADPLSARYWVEQVREAERGLLDFVTIEDRRRLHSGTATTPGPAPRARGRLDAIMIAARVAPHTEGVGIVAAAGTTLTEPFLLSTQIATLDFVSRGRAGWLAQVPTSPRDAAYVGPRSVPAGDARFDEPAEHIDVVRGLWDSWEDDAEIRDAVTHRFFDRGRVHHIDHEGRHFAITGPSITPRPPQGQPVIAVRGGSGPAAALASSQADVIIAAPKGLALDRIHAALAAAGREPADVRVLADVVAFLDRDRSAATERKDRLDGLEDTRDRSDAAVYTGTALELADQVMAWHELGYSGVALRPGAVPHDLQAITRGLVPELVRRGVFRRRYEADTLRGLLGLARPENRFGSGERVAVRDAAR